jgi:hypothetical protein
MIAARQYARGCQQLSTFGASDTATCLTVKIFLYFLNMAVESLDIGREMTKIAISF